MKKISYNKLWTTVWGDIQCFGPVHRHMRIHLVRTVSSLRVKRVLDVGCGSGENLAALADTGSYELTGVDVSKEAIHLAKRKVPIARLEILDIERETLPEQFDLVMCLQVLEHVLDDMSTLRNIASMAKSYVFLSTVQGKMRSSEIAIGHIRNYSPVELRRKLEMFGLEVLKIWEWGFPFYSPVYRTLTEWLPGGPPRGSIGKFGLLWAWLLYHIYRLNWPGKGDVIFALAKKRIQENRGHVAGD